MRSRQPHLPRAPRPPRVQRRRGSFACAPAARRRARPRHDTPPPRCRSPLRSPGRRAASVTPRHAAAAGTIRHRCRSRSAGGVADAEAIAQFSRHIVQRSLRRGIGAHQMRRQRRLRRAEPPDVQIVHLKNAWHRGQVVLHRVLRHAAWDRIHCQVDRFAQQPPGGRDDHNANRRDSPSDRATASR